MLTALIVIAIIRLSIKHRGFGPTLTSMKRFVEGSRSISPHKSDVDRIARRVALAGAIFPGRAHCLELSMALYYLLRKRGAPAELYIGVRPTKFVAHAWVESDGRPLNQASELLRSMVRFPVIAA